MEDRALPARGSARSANIKDGKKTRRKIETAQRARWERRELGQLYGSATAVRFSHLAIKDRACLFSQSARARCAEAADALDYG